MSAGAGGGDTAPLVELRGVTKSFEREGSATRTDVLRGIDLELAAGESVAVVGPSGSGKSTLLNVIGALVRPTSGTVRFAGRDLAGLDDVALARHRNEEIGFVFQSHHLLPQCTALENVLVPTLVREGGATREQAVERGRTLLARVGLGERLDHRPGRLSGGECQRVAIVRALINGPRLLLADEPTGSLDARTADEMSGLLEEVRASEGLTLLTVTHSERLAERMQRTLELSDGVLAGVGVGG